MKQAICLLAAVWLVFFDSCNKGNEDRTNAQQANKIVCVLFDLSQSTNVPEIREAYARDFRLALTKINRGNALVTAVITEKIISEITFCIKHDFPPFKAGTDNILWREA